MRHSLLLLALLLPSTVMANTEGTVAMSGRDFGKVSRVQIDGLPKEGYVLEPGNRGMELRFNKMPGKLSADDLPPGGAATRVKNAVVTEEGDTTILQLNYTCDCQAEVYEWQRKKLVIDIFSNEAVRNPDKIKEIPSKLSVTDDKKVKAKDLAKDPDKNTGDAGASAATAEATSTPTAATATTDGAAAAQQTASEATPNAAAAGNMGALVDGRPSASQQENSNAGAAGEQFKTAENRNNAPETKGSVAGATDVKTTADQKLRDGLRSALSAAQEGGVIRFKSKTAALGTDSGTNAMGGGAMNGTNNGRGNNAQGGDVATGQASNSNAYASNNNAGNASGPAIGGGGALSGNQTQGSSAMSALPTSGNAVALGKPSPFNGKPPQAFNATTPAGAGSSVGNTGASTSLLNGNVQTIIPGAPTGGNFNGNGATCQPDSAFAFNIPADQKNETEARADFYDRLTEFKGNLITEFDRTDPEAALQLAQYYTAYGFGDEAMGVLSSFSVPEQRGRTVQDIAELFTDLPPSKRSTLNVGTQCDGVHRVWSAYWALKNGDANTAAAIAQNIDAETDLMALPKSLRTQVGGDLALNLARHREFTQAEKLINIVAEKNNQHDPKVLLVRGMVEGEHGNAHAIIEKLNAVVSSAVDNNPEARLALAELKLSQNYPLSEDDLSSLEEIAYLHAQRKEGAIATALIAENTGQKKDIYGAFTHLSHSRYTSNEVDNPIMQQARTMFSAMAEKGFATDDAKNLNVYWDYPKLIPQEPQLLKSFAQRLQGLGYDKAATEVLANTRHAFPQAALSGGLVNLEAQSMLRRQQADGALNLLQQYPKDSTGIAMRLNAAQAYIKKGEPQKAVAQLAGLTQPDAVRLRAKAAWLSRDWNTAAQDYSNKQVFDTDSTAKTRAESARYMQTNTATAPLPTPDAAVNDAAKTIDLVKKALRHG